MKDYNFLNLSPPEFEELARDLLQKRENIILECFKDGKDDGIDFREPKKQIIVQVKRYKDDFKYFYNALKREVPSVERNKPKRYILVTSVRLSPKNKEEIYALFKPFIKDTADIIGGNDLNNLLSIYPEVEEMHHKLWVTSTRVVKKFLDEIRNSIEAVIYRKEINSTAVELEQVQKYSRLYVQTKSFSEALKILREKRYVIISGEPGIGKTTLGRALVGYLLEKENFEEFVTPTFNTIGFPSDQITT